MDIQSTVFYTIAGLILAMMVGLVNYSGNPAVYSQEIQDNGQQTQRISDPA